MAAIPTIGEMKHILKFELMDKEADTTGGNLEHGKEWFTTRGLFREMSGYRKLESGYDASVTAGEIFIWWRANIENDLSKDVQIIYDNRFFSVDAYKLLDEKRKMYRLTVKEVR
jgi:head-tail adaptor